MEDRDSITPMTTPMSCTPACSPSPSLAAREHHHHRIDLMDLPDPEEKDYRIPFFARRRSEHTWVVSLFVVVNLVAFVATMLVNYCPGSSGGGSDGDGDAGHCFLPPLGRFSFQPLHENPLLGPFASTLVNMGALRQTLTVQQGKVWPMVTSPWLHAGVIHLLVNPSSVTLLGNRLEQEFGTSHSNCWILCALLRLLGAMLAGLIRNWKIYIAKASQHLIVRSLYPIQLFIFGLFFFLQFSALAMMGFVAVINFCIGLLLFANNFFKHWRFLVRSSSWFRTPLQSSVLNHGKEKGLFDYDLNKSVKLKQKLDKPVSRIIALLLFIMILAGGAVAVLYGINANKHCHWCQFINCVPTKMWNCDERALGCEAAVWEADLDMFGWR